MRFVNLQSFWTNAALRKAPIDFEDVMVMSLLKECGELKSDAFMKLLGETRSQIEKRLTKLVELGLITTRPCPENQKLAVVTFTEQGQAYLQKVYEYFNLTSAIQRLPEEDQEALYTLLQKLEKKLDPTFDFTFGRGDRIIACGMFSL
jgi:DNA-binding MarR family transcriptional regulator